MNDKSKNEKINDDKNAVNDNSAEKESNEKLNNGESSETKTDDTVERIIKLEKELAEYKDKLLRQAAEFQNFKRRTELNQLNLIKYEGETFITNLLTVVDDFERSIQHFDSAKDIIPLKEGIKLVYDKLMKIFNEHEIRKIDAAGKPFDVQLHEAILQRKADGAEPHTVLDEVEKGYLYKDKVIRHSKVIVSEDTSEQEVISSSKNSDNNPAGDQ